MRESGNTCGFFFSSRRRHTRSKRDWSSDVCSSDLVVRITPAAADRHPPIRKQEHRDDDDPNQSAGLFWIDLADDAVTRSLVTARHSIDRSEERRVGKEWRSRYARGECKETDVITKM